MQTRKTFGIIGEGTRAKVMIGTDGRGHVELNVCHPAIQGTWTGPTLTVEQCRNLVDRLTGALCAAVEEREREAITPMGWAEIQTRAR